MPASTLTITDNRTGKAYEVPIRTGWTSQRADSPQNKCYRKAGRTGLPGSEGQPLPQGPSVDFSLSLARTRDFKGSLV